MGQCLKWCVNPGRRYFDRKYCKSPRRKRDMSTDISPEAVASATREAMALAFEKGADYFATVSLEDMKKKGIDLAKELPDAKGAVILGFYSMEEVALTPVLWANSLLVTNLLEKYGYSTITRSTISPGDAALACGDINSGEEPGEPNGLKRVFELVITACPVMTDVKPFNSIKLKLIGNYSFFNLFCLRINSDFLWMTNTHKSPFLIDVIFRLHYKIHKV